MKNIIKLLFTATGAILFLTSCEKKIDPIDDSFGVTVELKNSGTGFVTGDVEINPKDSIFFDFSLVSSNDDISWIEIKKNDTRIDTFKLSGTGKRSFSGTKRYMGDSAAGGYSYRFMAYNSRGVFLGDGGKIIKVTVKPDFNYWTYRFLYVPDTNAKMNTCYFSSSTGEVLNYTNGAAKSAQIDFGIYFDTTGTLTPSTTDDLKFSVYSLNSAQPQLSYYDISGWTKNNTIMKRASSPAFTAITSAGSLRTAGVTNLSSGTSDKITQLVSGNLVYFKTAAGKVGCMQINFANGSSPSKDSYLNVDVKIEK